MGKRDDETSMKLGRLYGYESDNPDYPYPLYHINRVIPYHRYADDLSRSDVKPILYYSIYGLIEFNKLRPI